MHTAIAPPTAPLLAAVLAIAGWASPAGADPPSKTIETVEILSRGPLAAPPDLAAAPTIDTARQKLSTWAVEPGDASYARLGSFLDRDLLPPAGAIRIGELLNAFDYGYPAARRTAAALALHLEVFPSPSRPGYHLLHLGLRARTAAAGRPTGEIVAGDVKGQLELDPRAIRRYRFVGHREQRLSPRQLTDPRTAGGDLAAGEQATALWEVQLAGEGWPVLGIVRVRYRPSPGGRHRVIELPIRRSNLRLTTEGASSAGRLAWIAATFGEALAASPEGRTPAARQAAYGQLLATFPHLERELRTRPRTAELRYLLGRARDLEGWGEARPPQAAEPRFADLPILAPE